MKRILKRFGALLLVLTLFTQTFGMHVSATGVSSSNTLSGNAADESSVNEDNSGAEEIQEGDIDLNDWQQIVSWFNEECNGSFLELESKDDEWWDSLLPNERRAAESYAKFIVEEDPAEENYTFETLEEAISKIEGGIALEDFFAETRFQTLELEDLYSLRDMGYTLDDLYLFMEAQYQPEIYESDLYNRYKGYEDGNIELDNNEADKLEALYEMSMKMMPMDYFGISMFWVPQVGDQYATMRVSPTGYGAGYNIVFGTHGTIYKLNVGGAAGFCMTYGASARSGYMYGDLLQTNDRIGWIVQNYANADNKSFVAAQIVIWCLQKGITSEGEVAALISTLLFGGVSSSRARASVSIDDVNTMVNNGLSALRGSAGKSATYYTLRGLEGSQIGGFVEPPTWSVFNGEEPPVEEEEPEPIIVDVPSMDNFYIEKEAKRGEWKMANKRMAKKL